MLILVVILALLPTVEGGPTHLFKLLESCQVDVELQVLLCGTVMAFDVSLLAMTDITGAFSKSFAAGNLTPLVVASFFTGHFVKLGCTPYLVFDSHAFTFGPKVATQQARRLVREKYENKLKDLKKLAAGLSGGALETNLKEQESALRKTVKYSPALQAALIDLAIELKLPYTVTLERALSTKYPPL